VKKTVKSGKETILQAANDRLRGLREKGGLKSRETHPVRRFLLKPTVKRAIAAKCWECCGGHPERWTDGLRPLMRDCGIADCPLWRFRPYKKQNK